MNVKVLFKKCLFDKRKKNYHNSFDWDLKSHLFTLRMLKPPKTAINLSEKLTNTALSLRWTMVVYINELNNTKARLSHFVNTLCMLALERITQQKAWWKLVIGWCYQLLISLLLGQTSYCRRGSHLITSAKSTKQTCKKIWFYVQWKGNGLRGRHEISADQMLTLDPVTQHVAHCPMLFQYAVFQIQCCPTDSKNPHTNDPPPRPQCPKRLHIDATRWLFY